MQKAVPPRADEWMTVSELAEWLKVPKPTIYAMNTQGTGPRRHKIGKQVRYRMRDIEKWLDTQAVA